ncbi:MAG: cobalt-zinc-cadmium efflux system protein [Actinomycetota bacterium]|nr:cobalt-zinc-cadmium efflux system protein [Actinomycetota bacterium]
MPDVHAHDHHAAPDHDPAGDRSARRERRLLIVLLLNLVIVVAQAVVGLVAHSLGLVADAGHSLTDVAAVAVSLYAVRLARRPATLRRSYGFHRSTVLAAQANAAALLAVTGFIAYFGVRGLLHPPDVQGGWVFAAAVVSAAVNGAAAWMLGHGHHHDLNMRSAALHMVGDAATSASVAVTAVVILVTGGYHWLDPAVSLLIAALIAVQAVRLVGETTDMLLESTPPGLVVDDLIEAILNLGSVDDVHDVHAWSLSPDVRAVSAHLVLSGQPSLADAQAVAQAAKVAVAERFSITHATFELECEHCVDRDTNPCCLGDQGSYRVSMAEDDAGVRRQPAVNRRPGSS